MLPERDIAGRNQRFHGRVFGCPEALLAKQLIYRARAGARLKCALGIHPAIASGFGVVPALSGAEEDQPPEFLAPPPAAFAAADSGVIDAERFDSTDMLRALYKLKGFDDATQELRNMWTRTGQAGLWFTGGAFSQARIYSRFIALQIAAGTLSKKLT